MKVLVTGGAGFIGSHVCDQLLEQQHNIVVVDNLMGGRLENIEHHLQRHEVEFHNVDIRDSSALLPCFSGVDWVIHLAGLADIVPSIEQPQDYFSTNVQGTLNVLECAKAAGVKRFVYAASSSCYGIPDAYPTPESADIRPQYPYALTKYMGEELVLHWGQIYQLPVVSLRLFNVYGPRVRTNGAYGAVFGVFLAQKARNKPLTVVGDGTQSRDFTYVTDVANAFVCAAQSEVSNQIFNVGSGGHYSINRLVHLIGGEVQYLPKRPGEPDCTFADTSKIRAVLDWRPQVAFEQGVAQMLNDLNAWQNAPLWDPTTIANATKTWFKYLDSGKQDDLQKSRRAI